MPPKRTLPTAAAGDWIGCLINGLYYVETVENEKWTKDNFAVAIG